MNTNTNTGDTPEVKTRANAVVSVNKMDGKLIFTAKGHKGEIVFDPDKVSAENRARAMIQGFITRISNGAALSADPETGKSASPADKFARMETIANHLMSGTTVWELRVAAPSGFDAGLVVRAIIHAAINGAKTPVDVEALVALTIKTGKAVDRDAALKFWAGTDKVISAIAALKAAAAPRGADDVLAEMLAAGE